MSIKAPWTDEQIEKLNEFQQSRRMHPFTCPGGNGCPSRTLKATNVGWVCACGEYRQDWAHEFMFRGAPPDPFAKIRAALASCDGSPEGGKTGTGLIEDDSAVTEGQTLLPEEREGERG